MADTELQPSEYTDRNATVSVTNPAVTPKISVEGAGALAQLPPSDGTSAQWQTIKDKVFSFLADLPDYLTEFFGEYKRPLVTIGLLLGGLVTVKLTLALLGAINDIPLLSPTFELIGIVYSAWFVYRYLLKASTRQELGEEVKTLKDQVLGRQ